MISGRLKNSAKKSMNVLTINIRNFDIKKEMFSFVRQSERRELNLRRTLIA